MDSDQERIIELPKIIDEREIFPLEANGHIPFTIKRSYWIYDVPGGEVRGHSYKVNQEFIIALSGSFDVIINNGKQTKIYTLNRSYYGLYIPANTWRSMENFSTNSLAFVVASTDYSENDYERNYENYISLKLK